MFTIPVAGLSPITEVVAHHNRISPINPAIYQYTRTLIEQIIDADLWDKVIQLGLLHDKEADSLLDIKGNVDALNTIGCTFTVGKGFTVNTTDYLNSNYIPSANDNVFATDSHSVIFCTNNRTAILNGYCFGIYYNAINSCDSFSNEFISLFWDYTTVPNYYNTPMSLSFLTSDAALNVDTDFTMVTRTGVANNTVSFLTDSNDDTSVHVGTTCTTFTFDQEILYGAANDISSVKNLLSGSASLSVFGIGIGMTVAECKILRTIIQTYLTSMGL